MDILISTSLIVLALVFSAYFGIALIKSENNLRETPERIATSSMGNRAHYMIIKYSELLSSPDDIAKAVALKNFQESANKYREEYNQSIREVIANSEARVKQFQPVSTEIKTNK
jgi:hypothetical protein